MRVKSEDGWIAAEGRDTTKSQVRRDPNEMYGIDLAIPQKDQFENREGGAGRELWDSIWRGRRS